jgi:hypothetical protein
MCSSSRSNSGLRSVGRHARRRRPGRVHAPGRPWGDAVDDREVDLVLVGVEVEEQLVDLVDDLGDAGVGPVDLVDHQDDRQVRLERLAQHEAGLGQRALGLASTSSSTPSTIVRPARPRRRSRRGRGVDDVDLDVAVGPGESDRGVLGQDRDALLALEVHRVHDPLGDVLVGAERAGLPEHLVDERGLAVVDVGDDRDVAQVRPRRTRQRRRRRCRPG